MSTGGKGGSSPAGQTTTIQKSDPWVGQQPFLIGGPGPVVGPNGKVVDTGPTVPGVLTSAANLYQNYTPQYFPSSTVAPFNPTQLAGLNLETNLGLAGTPAVNASEGFLGSLESGNFLSAGNPYFQTMANNVAAQITPQLEAGFNAGNRMNSPGAAYAVSKGLSDAIGGLAYQNYSDTLGNMIKGTFTAPSVQDATYRNVAAVQDAGNQQQAQAQAQLNDAINRFNFEQQLPYNKLGIYDQMVSGNFGGTSTLTQPYFQNQGANVLSGALGGATLGSSLLPSIFSGMSSGMGAGIGGVLGALSFFSDRRAKDIGGRYTRALKDLRRLTVSDAKYKWEGDDAKRPMIMADEVQAVLPHAVIGEKGGPLLQAVRGVDLLPMLVAGVNELSRKVERMERRA